MAVALLGVASRVHLLLALRSLGTLGTGPGRHALIPRLRLLALSRRCELRTSLLRAGRRRVMARRVLGWLRRLAGATHRLARSKLLVRIVGVMGH